MKESNFKSLCLGSGLGPCFVVHDFVFFLVFWILTGKRELVAMFWLSSWCPEAVGVLWLFFAVPWVGL